MSNPTSPPTGIYASRHAPKSTVANRVLPHMRKAAESPATPIKRHPSSDSEAPIPTMSPGQGQISRLELNPQTPDFTPAEAKLEIPQVISPFDGYETNC